MCSFSVDLNAPTASVPVTRNQTLVANSILNLDADGNTADDDMNGCAAMFPASTYAVRLIFSSGVRDIDDLGEIVPLGTDASAERAGELFRLLSAAGEPSADKIIGQADVDGDNIADVCVEGAGAQRDAAVLVVTCEDGAAVVSPDGVPCATPIVRPPRPLDTVSDLPLLHSHRPLFCWGRHATVRSGVSSAPLRHIIPTHMRSMHYSQYSQIRSIKRSTVARWPCTPRRNHRNHTCHI